MLRFVADESCIKLRPFFSDPKPTSPSSLPTPSRARHHPPAVDLLQDKLNKDQGTDFLEMFVCLFLAVLCPPISSKSKQKHE